MKVSLQTVGVTTALIVAIFSMSGCSTPPRVELVQQDDFRLDCTQLAAQFESAQRSRAEAEALRGTTINNVLGVLFWPQAVQIN